MRRTSRKGPVQAVLRILPAWITPVLACLAALALAGCAAPIAQAGKLAGGPGHTSAAQPVMQRPAVEQPAAPTMSLGARCDLTHIRASLHLAHVTVDSAS